MLKNLKFPLIYIIELVLWLPLLASFIVTAGFLTAKPISAINLEGKSLPTNWEAAVASHGKYIEWYLISNHAVAFYVGLLILLSSAALLYPVTKAQVWQQQQAKIVGSKRDTIAQLTVTAIIALLTYFIVFPHLIGVSPA
jgi:hypothetical protein